MYFSIFRKLLKSIPDYRFPEHGSVLCENACAYFYSDTLLCKFFMPEIQGRGVYPGDKLRALELSAPFKCSADSRTKTSQINEFQFYDVSFPIGNHVTGHWQKLASDSIEITLDMDAQKWRSLLVALHDKHPIYKYFHINFRTGAIETIAEARACQIENAITNLKNYEVGITKTQRARLTIDWATNTETTVMEDMLIEGALIPADFMHAMMLDGFRGILQYDYHNGLLEYHSFKDYPSLFDGKPRHFHIQTRTKCKSFPDLNRLANWDREGYDYFMFLCQKCLRSLRDQIRPYIDNRFRETVTFMPLPERGMRFQVKSLNTSHPMDFTLPNEQHNFPESLWQRPVVSFDPFYLFDLLAFDGDMMLRIKDAKTAILVEVDAIRLKHVVMPRLGK